MTTLANSHYISISMKQITLSPLPYASDALEPVISKQIVELHHDAHQATYVKKANENKDIKPYSFNYNGVVLHEIYWNNMRSPTDNNLPTGKIAELIDRDFGSFQNFKEAFSSAAVGVEGSGWAVLWKDADNNLTIGQLEKHNSGALNDQKPILVLDVWEHAYYLQYLNKRADYVESWWKVVNWSDVESRL